MSDAVENQNVEETPQIDEARVAVEKEAREQGWVPKEEFRGKETDWIDADIFVQRGKEINPILRKNNERIQKELEQARKELQELRMGVEEFKKFTKEAHERKIANYEVEIASLKEQKKQAISSGDGDLAVQLDEQIDAVKEAKAQATKESKEEQKQEPQQTINPKIQEWVDNNKWYSTNKGMAEVTNEIGARIRASNPFFNEEQFLEALDKELEDTFSLTKLGRTKAAKRENPMTETPQSGGNTASKGKHTYESMPADAKAACDSFLKQGIIKSKDEYVKMYYDQA